MSYETTPGRRTHVRLNPPDPVLLEPIVAQERTAVELLRGVTASNSGCWMKPETGWRLEPLQRRASALSELAALATSILGPADLTLPSGFVASPCFRQETDLDGVVYAPGVSETGDPFYQKTVQAGQSWDAASFVLSADQAGYPAPTAGAEDVPMDRVAVGTSIGGPNDELFLRFSLPGSRFHAPDHVLTVYFCGPAFRGTGQWALSLAGDGFATIYERGLDDAWLAVQRTVFCPAHQVGRAPHLVHIAPQTTVQNPKLSGVILFEFTTARSPAPAAAALGKFVPPSAETKQAVLAIPTTALAPQPAPIRLDVRRDLRLRFQLSRAAYPTSGAIQDDPFSTSFYPTPATPIVLAWSADVPAGCSLSGALFDASTGAPLAGAGTLGGFPCFSPDYPNRDYAVRFEFAGTGAATPTLFSYRVQRDAVLGASRAVETDLAPATVSLAITGADEDPSHESATLRLEDALGAFAGLLDTGEAIVQVESEYDPENPAARAVLHRGSLVRPEGLLRWNGRTSYRLSSVGMWQRLAEALSPIRYNFGLDYDSLGPDGLPIPFKVTDALRVLFALAGFGPASVDIPDLPVRLFASGDADGLLLEPQVALGELIVRYARDYLNYLVIPDPNVGSSGVWRLVPPASGSPALAAFQSAAAGSAGPPQDLDGYPAATAFLRKGSHRIWVRPPAGNVVIAFGAANAAAGNGVPQLYKQVVVNPKSFDFGGAASADPTSLDYLGRMRPIYQYLPAQASADAVSWVARRIYDASCRGARLHGFQAPLLFVDDPADPLLDHKRPLRVNDVVAVDGLACRLLNVNPAYAKDAHQFAAYEAVEL